MGIFSCKNTNLSTIYNKTMIMDEITKKKISLKLRGRKKSATHRKRISQSLTGRKLTKEHKSNIGKSIRELNKKTHPL